MTDEQRKKAIEQSEKNNPVTKTEILTAMMCQKAFIAGAEFFDNLIQEESRDKVIQECIDVFENMWRMDMFSLEDVKRELTALKSSPPKINS